MRLGREKARKLEGIKAGRPGSLKENLGDAL